MAYQVAHLEAKLTADTGQAKAELAGFGSDVNRLVSGYAVGSTLQGWGRDALSFVTDFVAVGAQIEQTMILVDRLVGGTGARADELTDKLFNLDQLFTFSANEVSLSMEQLAREGFTYEQIMGDATDAALSFAGAIREDVVLSTNIFGNVMRIFQDEGLESSRVADILTQAVLRSGRPAAEMATGFQYIGGVAAELGIPLFDVASMLTLLTREGIKTRSAGTGLRTMFLELANPSEKAIGLMDQYGIVTKDAAGNFLPMIDIIESFHTALSGLNDSDALGLIEGIFGKSASSPLLTLFREGPEGLQETQDAMTGLGPAMEIMNALMDTTAGSIDKFQSAWLRVKASLGAGVGAFARPVIDFFTALLNAFIDLPQPLQTAVGVLIALAGALAFLGGTLILFQTFGGFGVIVAGVSAMLAPITALLSPLALLAGALAVLIALNWDTISDGLGAIDDALSISDRVTEFLSDISKVYDRLREPAPSEFQELNSLTAQYFGTTVAPERMGKVEAGIRAFGSALEDLTGIEMSRFWGNIAQGADALFAGDWSNLATQVREAIDVLNLETIPLKITGFVWDTLPDVLGWIKEHLLGGGNPGGYGGTRGDSIDNTSGIHIDIEKIALNVLGYVWGKIEDAGAWIKEHLLGGGNPGGFGGSRGDSIDNTSGVHIDIPQITLNVLGYVWGKVEDAWAWIKEHLLGATVGGYGGSRGDSIDNAHAIDIPQVTLNVLSGIATFAEGFYDSIEPYVTVAMSALEDVTGWKLTIGPPGQVEVDWSGIADRFWENLTSNESGFNQAFEGFGDKVGEAIIKAIFGGSSGGDGTGVENPFEGYSDSGSGPIGSFVDGFVGGMWGQIKTEFSAKWDEEMAQAAAWWDAIKSPFEWINEQISGWFEGGGKQGPKSIVMGPGSPFGPSGTTASSPFASLLDDLIQPLRDWKMPDISNPFDGLGGTIQGWINDIPMPSIPEWIKVLTNDGPMGLARWLTSGGGGEGWSMPEPVAPPGYGPKPPPTISPSIGFTTGGDGGGGGGFGEFNVGRKVAPPDFSDFLKAHDTAFADSTSKFDVFATDATNKGQMAADGFKNMFSQGLDDAIVRTAETSVSIGNLLQNIAEDATIQGQNAGDGFKNMLGQGLLAAVLVGMSTQLAFITIFTNIATSAMGAGLLAGLTFAQGIQGGMQSAIGYAQAGAFAIVWTLSGISLFGAGYSMGASLGDGLVIGVQSRTGAAFSAGVALGQAAAAGTALALALASPSKVMIAQGIHAGDGLVIGIRNRIKAVRAAGADLARAAAMGAAGVSLPVGAVASGGGDTFIFTDNVMGRGAEQWAKREATKAVRSQVTNQTRRTTLRSSRRS